MAKRAKSEDGVGKEADYDIVIAEVFKRLHTKKDYAFTKDHIVEVMETLKKSGHVDHIKNIPDIKYTYDARRDFPSRVSSTGHWGIVGEGKAKYRFVALPQNNLIRIPKDIEKLNPSHSKIKDVTPAPVSAVLGNDEQATMTRARYNDLISVFLGAQCWQVQGHERTTVSCGQIEVDEVYVGVTKTGEKIIVPISAKGGDKDCLSYTQALNLSLYAKEKVRFWGYKPVPMGVLRKSTGEIYLVRFSAADELPKIKIEDVAVYHLI